MNTRVVLVIALICATGASLSAAGPAIGFAVTNGAFQVDNSQVKGNSSLFEGSTVATMGAASKLQLNSGASLQLAADSRARVYESRAVLEKGLSQLQASSAYQLEARKLQISAVEPNTVAQVSLSGNRMVMVAAVSGAVKVMNAQGVLVANVAAGRAASFDTQAGAPTSTKATGCVERRDGRIVLVDKTTNVILEVQGSGIDKELGNTVEITGTAAGSAPVAACASQLVNVTAVKRISEGCGKKFPVAAVVGGIGVAGVVGGLAAAGTFSDGGGPTPISR